MISNLFKLLFKLLTQINLFDQEKDTIQQLEKWSLIEESVMRQKSRVKWVQLGDANTSCSEEKKPKETNM